MKFRKCFDPHVSCRPGLVTANQHIFKSGLSNIEAQFMKKLSNTEAELKQSVAYIKNVYFQSHG